MPPQGSFLRRAPTDSFESALRDVRRQSKEEDRKVSRELYRGAPKEDPAISSSSAAGAAGEIELRARISNAGAQDEVVGMSKKESRASRGSKGSKSSSCSRAQERQNANGIVSSVKLKALANKMRHKVHAADDERRRGGAPSYASLDAEASSPSSDSRPKGLWRDWAALCSILRHPFTVLLLALPMAFVAHVRRWGALSVFWLNIVALVPLAKILGDGTEELAAAIRNDTISGLLNATLGNAVEVILSLQTLRKGLLDVVKATLLGSILSNILLVLGTSFLLGGIVGSKTIVGPHHVIYDEDFQESTFTGEKEQIFSSKSALVNMAMQLLACMTCALPTVFYSDSMRGRAGKVTPDMEEMVLKVSRISAVMIMVSYIASILFQLVTHKRMLNLDEGAESDDEEGEDEAGMSAGASIGLMAVTTCIIAVSSELMVGAIETVVADSVLSASFIGIILLPFAGNACEHASAIRFAMQDRPGLSIGIAVGSSTQIALFVVPFTVIAGWVIGQPMDLMFGEMNTLVMILSVLVALVMVIDGRSNWLKGFMLCIAYLFEAVLYWAMPEY